MRLKIVGSHLHALGSECVIFGHVGVDAHAFTPIGGETLGRAELAAFGRWDNRPMRPGLGSEMAPALVGSQAGGDHCRTTGRLVVLSHSWSGRLQINNLDRKYTVDLYSQPTRLVLLDLIAEIMVDLSSLAQFEKRRDPLAGSNPRSGRARDRGKSRLVPLPGTGRRFRAGVAAQGAGLAANPHRCVQATDRVAPVA